MFAAFPKPATVFTVLARANTLKFSVFLATGLLATALICRLSLESIQAWKTFQYAKAVRAGNKAGNELIEATFYLLREQPMINDTFNARIALPDDFRQVIDQMRRAADDRLDSGLRGLSQLDFPNKIALSKTLQDIRKTARTARDKARAMADAPADLRDPATLSAFNDAISALTEATQNLWNAAGYSEVHYDAALSRYATIKNISWELYEIFVGQRSVVSDSISSRTPVTAAGNRAIDKARAQIRFGLQLLSSFSDQDEKPSPVGIATAEASQSYFQTFEPLADRMRQIGNARAPYPMSYIDWIDQTNISVQQFFDVLIAAAKAGETHAARLEADSFFDFTAKIAGIAIAFLTTVICFLVVVRRVTDPLARVSGIVRELAAGRLDVAIADTERRDEIGEVARAIDNFKSNLIQTRDLAASQIAEGLAKERRVATLENLAKDFEAKITGVAASFESSATDLEATSRSLSFSAEQTNQESHKVAAAAWQTSETVQTVAAATGQLALAARDIGDRVAASSRIARNAVDYSRNADTTIKGLMDAADKIGEVVKLISTVAQKTNLLALNATIEAARAGDAGRGFSVVAGEVKLLAGQTAKATEQINSQIAHIQSATHETVLAIRNMDAAILEVDSIATEVAQAVSLQQAATHDIARKIDETATDTDDVTQSIAEVQQAAMETREVAAELLASAGGVARGSSLLRAEVESFLAGVRRVS